MARAPRGREFRPFEVVVEVTENDYGCAWSFSAPSTTTGEIRLGLRWGSLTAGVAVARYHVLCAGQLGQAHRAAGVQLLRGDADLRTEPELAAVGEPRRRVDHHRGGVHPGGETSRGRDRLGDDRLGVPGAVPADVVERVVDRVDDRGGDVRRQVLG